MGTKFERSSQELIQSTAEALTRATAQFTQLALDMRRHGLTDAYFPWTKRQVECLNIVNKLATACVARLPPQIVAKTQNRRSYYEVVKLKSQRDAATRKARNALAAAEPARSPKRNRA